MAKVKEKSMNNVIKNTQRIIFTKQRSIFSSVIIISSMIIVSRIFGFIRYRVLSNCFSTSQLDIYFSSFRIPDIIFEILISGALTASFIPIYIKYRNKKNFTESISSIISTLLVFLLLSIFVLFFLMPEVVKIITPGFSPKEELLIIFYARILLVAQLPFLALGNVITGILQSNKIFFVPALAPIIYNLFIIFFTLLFYSQLGLFAPILGVITGALFFFIIQLPVVGSVRFKFKFVLKKTRALVEFVRMVIPRTFTIIASQIDATVDLSLTTLLQTGSYTEFFFAQRLQLLPVSVLGMAFGQASLPYLSQMYQEGKKEALRSIIIDSILNIFFFIIPISFFFIFARTPLVRLFFGGKKFSWEATVQTALTLSAFAISIPAHSIYYLLVRVFYSFLDSKTPFYISATFTFINTILSIIFILFLHFSIWSLGISFSISIILNTTVLLFYLYKKIGGLDIKKLVVETIKISSAAFLSSVINYFFLRFLDGWVFVLKGTISVIYLLTTISISFLFLYILLSYLFDVKELYLLTKLMLKAKEFRRRIIELYLPVE